MSKPYDRKDRLYRKAKSEGYRSRASYKLDELNQKHKLMRDGSRVLDLGAWPGGWLQYCMQAIGQNGKAVGIDLVKIEDLADERIMILVGDVTDSTVVQKARDFVGGKFDLVLSDMSPKLSGIREADQARSTHLAECALEIARLNLESGGNFVCKVFKGADADGFVKTAKPMFNKLVRAELDATRKSSNEFYVVGLGLR